MLNYRCKVDDSVRAEHHVLFVTVPNLACRCQRPGGLPGRPVLARVRCHENSYSSGQVGALRACQPRHVACDALSCVVDLRLSLTVPQIEHLRPLTGYLPMTCELSYNRRSWAIFLRSSVASVAPGSFVLGIDESGLQVFRQGRTGHCHPEEVGLGLLRAGFKCA
jgi:hypothetical protein